MPNVNKVMLGDTPLIDLSTDTLETSDQVLTGLQATNKYGEKIIGTGVWSEEDAPAYDYPIGGSYVGSDGSEYYPTCTGFHVYSNTTKVRPYAFYDRMSLQSVDVSMADEIGDYALEGCTALTSITVKNGVLVKSRNSQCKFASFNNHLYWSKRLDIYVSDATSGSPTKTLICTLSSSVPSYTYTDGPYTITFTRSGSTNDFTVTWTQRDEESNLNVNKVCVGDNTLIDVSVDDVTDANNVYEGVVFHKQDGSVATGTGGTTYDEYSIGGSIIDDTATGYKIGSDVRRLGWYCFYGCSSLTSTGLENSSVTSLGSSCFYGCTSLTNEVMPSTLTSMGYYCFYYCSNLESIDCSSVNTMEYACFENCNKLSNIIVKNGVKITPAFSQVKIATINGKMYWQNGTLSNSIYVSDPAATSPTTVIGTLTSMSPTFTYDDGAGYSVTFTRVDSDDHFTITWTTSNEGDENNG